MHKLPVGVLGASGYAGRELCALIEGHPSLELAFASAHGQRGQTLRVGKRNITFVGTEEAPLGDAALVFSALPHGASLEWVEKARSAGAKAVDLSSDLRIGNGRSDVPYGLTELRRSQIIGADLVANPGCYPTAILLALAPLASAGLLDSSSSIAVSAASGVTGAGFTPRPDLLFAEVSEDFRAYGVGNAHRHLAEMRALLGELGTNNDLIFTPHLLPVARGILATIVVRLNADLKSPLAPWLELYSNEPFIEVSATTPSLRDVVRRNTVKISAAKAENTRQPTLIITSAIDNLTKGAAGQALQNANLMLGLEETAGLPV
ncbi:MAG TPA: N-acetyl-gamma-glutamyl-phosphate reductase [Gemmatimonadaceae bacterium]|nr:N-acetyl-gamma-glutamyl-phosphate reductase [Gemmatimonadaceae bacterium]